MSVEYEIFEASKRNDLKKVRDLLDAGVDVDLRDFDNDATPLHYAASNGGKSVMELLIERGANINVQNKKGTTPLHVLIMQRYDAVALWLIKQGANMHLTDNKGFSARDLAHQWVQKEMDDAASGKFGKVNAPNSTATPLTTSQGGTVGAGMTRTDEAIKLHFSNQTYKTVNVEASTTAADLCKVISEKLNMAKWASYLEIVEIQRQAQRKFQGGELILAAKSKWPLIFGKSGNETDQHCYFLVSLKQGSPDLVVSLYAEATKV